MAKKKINQSTITELPRIYGDSELQNFDSKVKKFYEDRTLSSGKVNSILNYDELGVAFGAFVKILGASSQFHYAIPSTTHVGEKVLDGGDRYRNFWNLMDQWKWWKHGKEAKLAFARIKEAERIEEGLGGLSQTKIQF